MLFIAYLIWESIQGTQLTLAEVEVLQVLQAEDCLRPQCPQTTAYVGQALQAHLCVCVCVCAYSVLLMLKHAVAYDTLAIWLKCVSRASVLLCMHG